MKFAIVNINNNQYKVIEGQELLVDHLIIDKKSVEKGQKIEIDQVLLINNEDKIVIGNPTISRAKIIFTVLSEEKGDKIRVSTYKAKARERKTIGFRASLNRLKVEQIVIDSTSRVKKVNKKAIN